MSVLFVAAEPGTALKRSLGRHASQYWTTNPETPGIVATVMVDGDSHLVPNAAQEILARLHEHPDVDAFIVDAVVAGAPRLRGAWSPNWIAARPENLDFVVARGVHPSGALADRLRVLFSTDDQRIGHLAKPMLLRTAACEVSDADRELAESLLAARYHLPRPTGVSVIIPTAGTHGPNGRLVDGALRAVFATGIEDLDVMLVVGEEYRGIPEDLLTDPRIRLVRRPPGAWNFSESINLGLLPARHDAVLLLNDDTELSVTEVSDDTELSVAGDRVNSDWLDHLLGHLSDPTVAAVGALLLYPDRTVQHAGMIIDDAFPLHCFVGRTVDELATLGGDIPRDMIAVTAACMLVRRSAVMAVGGLCEKLPGSFNDVDLCLKLRRHGHRVVFEPAAQLVHLESASRDDAIKLEEWNTFVGRWGQIDDPWYHPGFHRPDLPHNRRLNADHLPPIRTWNVGSLRQPMTSSTFHQPRLRPAEQSEPTIKVVTRLPEPEKELPAIIEEALDSNDIETLRRDLLTIRDRMAVIDAQREVLVATIANRDHLVTELSHRVTDAEESLKSLRSFRSSTPDPQRVERRRRFGPRNLRISFRRRSDDRHLRRRGFLR